MPSYVGGARVAASRDEALEAGVGVGLGVWKKKKPKTV